MNYFGLILGGTALVSAAIGGTRKLVERRRVRRDLELSPDLGAETPEGTVVRVTGIVRKRDTLIVAPLSGIECVAARARVATGVWHTRGAVKPREWFAIVSFMLERDSEPPVVIEGQHARIALPSLPLRRARAGSPEMARREQLILQLGENPTTAFRASCSEVAIVPGMRVSVAGLMMLGQPDVPPSADEARLFRELPASTLRLVGNATHPLVIGTPVA